MKFPCPFHRIRRFYFRRLVTPDRPLSSSGMALCLCLLMISTLCLLGGAALTLSTMNYAIVHNGQKRVQAFYVAEAGREKAMAELRQNPLWRGDEETASASGVLSLGGGYTVTFSDATEDGNGVYDSLLPAGYVSVSSIGEYLDASQKVACFLSITPGEEPAAFPKKAVLSSGSLSGSLIGQNNYGDEASLLLQFETSLPDGNGTALKAMADGIFSSLDNDVYDKSLSGAVSFWRDSADTLPHIFCIDGDVTLSGAKTLCGIIFALGTSIVLSGEVTVKGVIYAPHATHVVLENGSVSGAPVIVGQLITGSGGVQVMGNPVIVRLCNDYVDAFNDAAGSAVNVSMVPGTWASF